MKKVRWNPLKSFLLKQKFGISFEDLIKDGIFVDEIQHPSRDNQKIFIYEYKHYLWSIPFVIEENGVFLKTMYPSRKLMRKYEGANNEEI